MRSTRILFFADTHLGFDLPQRPRRGHDFFANFERVLQVALDEEVDVVVHGGDLFFRSRIPPDLVQRAFLPLKRIADAGIPIFLVPGNHERSRIPYAMLALHRGIQIFDRPKTFVQILRGRTVAFAGFPFYRGDVRNNFRTLLDETRWHDAGASLNLLCVHHCFEGATVGPGNYVFRQTNDAIRLAEVPGNFAAVLSGHIHRHQVLERDLGGRLLNTPVLYPGSIERTSFAEKDEPKGYSLLEVVETQGSQDVLSHWEFRQLPARPMLAHDLRVDKAVGFDLESVVRRIVAQTPADAILCIRIHGHLDPEQRTVMKAANLRAIAPATMNVVVVMVDGRP